MEISPIRTDADHRRAIEEIDRLWGAREGTPEGDRLDILATLVDAYEDKRWPMAEMDPSRRSRLRCCTRAARADLAALIGQSRATEVLKRRLALTLPMIRKIAAAWHVPEQVLVRDYKPAG